MTVSFRRPLAMHSHLVRRTIPAVIVLAIAAIVSDPRQPGTFFDVRKGLARDTTFHQEVTWAPDGCRISISRLEIDGGYRSVIGVMQADGSSFRELAGGEGARWTSWSPDGLVIAFASGQSESQDIYLIGSEDEAGPNRRRRLTEHEANDTHPDWSPDGTRILFVSNREGSPDIFVMDADGSNQRRVLQTGEDDWNPRWSPEGGMITWYATSPGGEDSVYVAKADGTNRRTVAAGIWPSWSPDGKSLLYSFDNDIHRVSLETNESTRLIDDGFYARWSPDASQIAFIRTTWRSPEGWPSTSDVFVWWPDDARETQVTGR